MVYTIPALMRLKQEDRHKFEARLGCMSRPSLRGKKKKRILIFLPISRQVSSLWHYRVISTPITDKDLRRGSQH